MADVDIKALEALGTQVLWAAFALAVAFGAIAQRTHFCTMGAVGDAFTLRDFTRLRQWALAAGVAILGFWALAAAGQIDPAGTMYSGNRWLWLSGLVGGLMFGFGMVLGSGCGSKTLVRVGGGNLKSLVVFLALGVSAFATLKGITAVARVATVDRVAVEFAQPALLPVGLAQAAGWPLPAAGVLAALVIGGALVLWALLGRGFRTFDNLLAGSTVGDNGEVIAPALTERGARVHRGPRDSLYSPGLIETVRQTRKDPKAINAEKIKVSGKKGETKEPLRASERAREVGRFDVDGGVARPHEKTPCHWIPRGRLVDRAARPRTTLAVERDVRHFIPRAVVEMHGLRQDPVEAALSAGVARRRVG